MFGFDQWRKAVWGVYAVSLFSIGFAESAPLRSLRIVEVLPHDPTSFTQCLMEHPDGSGDLIEGTGLYGKSELRRVRPSDGAVVKALRLEQNHFGEGCAVLNGELYQLTWREGVVFVRDPETFREKRRFRWNREGWGAAAFGDTLWISDGSDTLFLVSSVGEVLARLPVKEGTTAVRNLNELAEAGEWVIANVWGSDRLAVIDRSSGTVVEWWNGALLRNTLPAAMRGKIDVLNGVARASRGGWWLTGKYWPYLFRVIPEKSLTQENSSPRGSSPTRR